MAASGAAPAAAKSRGRQRTNRLRRDLQLRLRPWRARRGGLRLRGGPAAAPPPYGLLACGLVATSTAASS
jgi:hypothetical protein